MSSDQYAVLVSCLCSAAKNLYSTPASVSIPSASGNSGRSCVKTICTGTRNECSMARSPANRRLTGAIAYRNGPGADGQPIMVDSKTTTGITVAICAARKILGAYGR